MSSNREDVYIRMGRSLPERLIFSISVDLEFQIQFCREHQVVPLVKGKPEVEVIEVELRSGSVGELLHYLDTEMLGRQVNSTNTVLEALVLEKITPKKED